MELDEIILLQLDVINNYVPTLTKADNIFSIPLILEYIETVSNKYGDKEFLKSLKNYYLMDTGCIILDNFNVVRNWDVGQSLSMANNTYFIRYDPSNADEKINLVYVEAPNTIDVIDVNDPDNKHVTNLIKSSGVARFEALKASLENIRKNRIINVDKSQLPSLRLNEGRIALDYTMPLNQNDPETKAIIMNVMLKPYLTNVTNLTFIKSLAAALKK